jgi:hypothetical protein
VGPGWAAGRCGRRGRQAAGREQARALQHLAAHQDARPQGEAAREAVGLADQAALATRVTGSGLEAVAELQVQAIQQRRLDRRAGQAVVVGQGGFRSSAPSSFTTPGQGEAAIDAAQADQAAVAARRLGHGAGGGGVGGGAQLVEGRALGGGEVAVLDRER